MALVLTTSRDVTITFRADKRLRFALELLSRHRRASLTDVLATAVEEMAQRELPAIDLKDKKTLMDAVWDPFDQDRLVKLAMLAPDLLTDEERKVWTVICESAKYMPKPNHPNFAAIRSDWKRIQTLVAQYETAAKKE